MQAQYGQAPKVSVVYWDGVQYVAAGILTSIKFDTYPVSNIIIDHGALATGIVKLN